MNYSDNFVAPYLRYGTWYGEMVRHFCVMGYAGYNIRFRTIRRILKPLLADCQRVLDIGCGVGDHLLALASHYPHISFTGIDYDPRCISDARRRASYKKITNAVFKHQNCLDLTYQKYFDLVYCVDVLEHIENVQQAIVVIHNVLKLHGHLAIHVPNIDQTRHFSRLQHIDNESHVREGFSAHELTTLLQQHDLNVQDVSYTHGRFGAFAWELSFLTKKKPFLSLALIPFIQMLCIFDTMAYNPIGNGVLIHAKRGSTPLDTQTCNFYKDP